MLAAARRARLVSLKENALKKKWNLKTCARGLLTAAAIAAAGLSIVACSSAPQELRIKHNNPLLPIPNDIEWKRSTPPGPGESLPPGYTPEGNRPITIIIDGKEYTITVCVAKNPAEPRCVYIKHGDCDKSGGWIKYCPAEAAQEAGGGESDGGGSNDAPDCTSGGAVEFDLLSEFTKADVVVGCDLYVDEDLDGVSIAHANTPGAYLDSDTFRSTYGNVMPAGSRFTFKSDAEAAAWNSLLLKATQVTFTTTTGDKVGAGITTSGGSDIPPVSVVVLNGNIVSVRFIYDSN
jgi:hypothetical protein